MKKSVWIVIVVVIVLALIVIGFFVLTNNKEGSSTPSGPIKCNDPPCLGRYFSDCTPAELTMSQEDKTFVISIKGLEGGKCHFTMVMDGITAADCYFTEEQRTNKVLNQMFGNPEGQDAIIAEACMQLAHS